MAERGRRPGHGQGREALLAATVHVVAREGLRGLTYRAVAEEAGVANTLVAHHFGTRDALLQAALEWAAEQSIGISLLEPATGRLEDFAAGLAELVAGDADMQAFQYELALEARRRPELLPAVERMYAGYVEATRRELMRLGLDEPSDDLARAVFALLDGIVLQETLFGARAGTEAVVERLRELLRSAGARSASAHRAA
jgi:TetR/AcrR family transcriptional regulator, regulator of biofilm formation and stress response